MIVVHKKTKLPHEITHEHWKKMKSNGMHRHYNVIDNSEMIVKEIKMPSDQVNVNPMNLGAEQLKEWLKDHNVRFDSRIKDIKKLQKLIP